MPQAVRGRGGGGGVVGEAGTRQQVTQPCSKHFKRGRPRKWHGNERLGSVVRIAVNVPLWTLKDN